MIANERQYRITTTQAEKFAQAIADLDARPLEGDPRMHEMMRAGMAEQLAELRAELDEYEALRDGRVTVLEHVTLDRLGESLIQARIAAGLTQRALAARLNLPEQEIQRYEQSRYEAAGLRRLLDIARALGVQIQARLLLPVAEHAIPVGKPAD